MKSVLLVVVGSMVLGGCAGIDVHYAKDRRMIIEHETNFTRPSFTKVTSEICVQDETAPIIETKVDNTVYRCHGRYVAVNQPNFAAQEGAATGLGSAVVLGGAAVGTGYFIGDGLGDSGSNTTNNNDTSSNGGNSNSLSSARSESFSNSNAAAAASGGAGGNGYGGKGGAGGSVNYGKHRR